METAPGADAVPATQTRAERSTKDMALSLLVLLVPIALLLGFYRMVLDADEPVVVDPAPAIAEARSANAFPVSEPVGLGGDWLAVSASFRRAEGGRTLRIGYVTPQGGGLQVVQSNVPVERLLPVELTGGARSQGAAQLSGRTWQRYTARAGERALVLLEPDRTVIVIGVVAESELHHLAGKLAERA